MKASDLYFEGSLVKQEVFFWQRLSGLEGKNLFFLGHHHIEVRILSD